MAIRARWNPGPLHIMNPIPHTIVLTIGHSTRPIEEFLYLLRLNAVSLLVDIRTAAGSRYNPQYNQGRLAAALDQADIEYLHMSGLGGVRQPHSESPNTGWRNKGFRGFADYMQTTEFKIGLELVISLAGRAVTVLMCAEAVPWRCHRSLIADALLVRGVRVAHIVDEGEPRPHVVTAWARVEGTRIIYPAML